ncbi:MAG: DUF721 domain-containing protein [Treponema sp.]|nr:DUF721 domain-containing protein [Treponema sp.]
MNRVEIVSCKEMIDLTWAGIEKATLEENNKFYKAWKYIITKINGCGQNLYDHSRIIDLKNGILLIETDHPGWTQLMQMYSKFILRGLKMNMPEIKVDSLAFRVKGSKAELSSDYDSLLKSDMEKEKEKILRQEKVLKKYDKKDDKDKAENSQEIPENLLNMFKSMKESMLTKNVNN